jgi:uncharacterized membrane protein YgcG
MSDIERELEETLHRVLDPISARPVPPRRTVHGRSAFRTVVRGAGAALTVKVLTGIAAAAAAVTVAGAATTGSINPVIWGQTITSTVQTCKDNIANSGGNGIGPCVSAVANTHGATVASEARNHSNPSGSGNGNANGNGNGGSNGNSGANAHGNGRSGSHPTPPPRSGR